jgi:SAM-dependent methyltransferase
MTGASPVMETADLVDVDCCLCGGKESTYERTLNGFKLVRCRACSFVYCNPRLSSERLTKLYTSKDPSALIQLYSKIATPDVITEYGKTLDYIEQHVPGRGRLLDYACAAGYFFELASKRGWEAHGVDIGAWTQAAADARGLRNLHVGTLSDLNFPDEYFDVVYAAQVFEHLPQPREELTELRRILRPGGLLYVDVPNYRCLSIACGVDDFELNMPPQHINYFSAESLYKLVNFCKFADIDMRTSGGLKWENFFGRSIRSDIAAAYRPGKVSRLEANGSTSEFHQRWTAARFKDVIRAWIVKPILYDRLKLGITLSLTGRRPSLPKDPS